MMTYLKLLRKNPKVSEGDIFTADSVSGYSEKVEPLLLILQKRCLLQVNHLNDQKNKNEGRILWTRKRLRRKRKRKKVKNVFFMFADCIG